MKCGQPPNANGHCKNYECVAFLQPVEIPAWVWNELQATRTDLAATRAEAERAKALAVEKTAQIASLQNDAFTAHALNESRCAALAKECEELGKRLLRSEESTLRLSQRLIKVEQMNLSLGSSSPEMKAYYDQLIKENNI
jgi:hypothetical protein